MEKYEIHKFLEEYKQKLMDMHQALQIPPLFSAVVTSWPEA